jgi:hypothetical protein
MPSASRLLTSLTSGGGLLSLLRFCRTLLFTLLAEYAFLKILDLRILILACIFQFSAFLFDSGMLRLPVVCLMRECDILFPGNGHQRLRKWGDGLDSNARQLLKFNARVGCDALHGARYTELMWLCSVLSSYVARRGRIFTPEII